MRHVCFPYIREDCYIEGRNGQKSDEQFVDGLDMIQVYKR